MIDAFDWYEDRVPGIGSEFLLCVDAVFNAIVRASQRYPHIHKIVRRALTRRFPYEVFIVEGDERVVVLSVFHAKTQPKAPARANLESFEQRTATAAPGAANSTPRIHPTPGFSLKSTDE